MKTLLKNGWVYDIRTDRFDKLNILFDKRILKISASDISDPHENEIDAEGLFVMPGLVDVHTHGCAGSDFIGASAGGLERMSRFYLNHGVTSVMATLASAEVDTWISSINAIQSTKAPIWKGIHLEGRYLNPAKRGAHAEELLGPLDPEELQGILRSVHGARHVTAALELDPDQQFLKAALAEGATVSLGHTMADYQTAEQAFRNGASAATHLFNAMPSIHHRAGGAVVAALLSDAYCELIADGLHIAPEVIRMVYRLKGDKTVLITDSMEGTGGADGIYQIAGEKVLLSHGEARTENGALAGSTLTLDRAVSNFMAMTGCSFGKAWMAASYAPAREIGLEQEIGSIKEGLLADIDLVSESTRTFEIIKTYQEGIDSGLMNAR